MTDAEIFSYYVDSARAWRVFCRDMMAAYRQVGIGPGVPDMTMTGFYGIQGDVLVRTTWPVHDPGPTLIYSTY